MPLDRMDELLEADAVARLLGIRRAGTTGGVVAVSLTVDERHLNFVGVVHGGVVFTLADTALALASNGAGRLALATNANIVLSAPGRTGDVLTAEAFEVASGSRLATYRVPVVRSDGRVLASFDGTVYRPPA